MRFADTIKKLNNEAVGDYYCNSIYTQRFLSKWVYRGGDLTMISVDTHTDGNKFLITRNKSRLKHETYNN